MQLKQMLLPIGVLLGATPVAADISGSLNLFGRALETIFGGIFNAFSTNPAVWMKVVLIIALFSVLTAGLKKGLTFMHGHNNALTMLALALSIAMVAPLPGELVTNLFGFSGLLAALVFLIPIVLLMYFTYTFTNDAERFRYIVALMLWVVALFYVLGLGAKIATYEAGASVEGAQVIAMFVCGGYIIVYLIKSLAVGKEGAEQAANFMAYGKSRPGPNYIDQRRSQDYQKEQAKLKPASAARTAATNQALEAIASASTVLTDCKDARKEILSVVPSLEPNRRSMSQKLRKIHAALLTLKGKIRSLRQNTQVIDALIAKENPALVGNVIGRKWNLRRKRDEGMLDVALKKSDQDLAELVRQLNLIDDARHPVIDWTALSNRLQQMQDFYAPDGEVRTALELIRNDL